MMAVLDIDPGELEVKELRDVIHKDEALPPRPMSEDRRNLLMLFGLIALIITIGYILDDDEGITPAPTVTPSVMPTIENADARELEERLERGLMELDGRMQSMENKLG